MSKDQTVKVPSPEETKEKILYVYRCPECHKFYETNCKNDTLVCSCGTQTVMSTPEFTIKHYKKSRAGYNFLTIMFTIILPVITLCLAMFVKETNEANQASLGYNLPILAIVLIGAIIFKGKDLLERTILDTDIYAIRCILVFISKNVMYIVLIAVLGIIFAFLDQIGKSLGKILIALGTVVIENSIGYCVFDYKFHKANYIIKRALRQSETIQAMEMSGR